MIKMKAKIIKEEWKRGRNKEKRDGGNYKEKI